MSLRVFVDMNEWMWQPVPPIDEAEKAVLAIAAGDWDEVLTAAWLREHLVQKQ